jgi:hypothetical protein
MGKFSTPPAVSYGDDRSRTRHSLLPPEQGNLPSGVKNSSIPVDSSLVPPITIIRIQMKRNERNFKERKI